MIHAIDREISARLLPRFRAHVEAIERATKIDAIIRLVGANTVDVRAVTLASAGGDSRKLRGIPCLAKGVSSTMAGTNPQAALDRKQPRS